MPDIGFVDGQFMPLSEARVSVEDRGYQFGDGVYEVIRTYGGIPFQVDAHLARLEQSAAAIKLLPPYRKHEWVGYVAEGLRLARYPESKVYIQITRGVAPRDHVFPPAARPTVVMTVREMQELSEDIRVGGVEAVTVEDLRWGRCDIKSLNLLPNILARQQAKEAGAFEAIFVREGEITEGAVSNVMIIHSGALVTSPSGPKILAGVTRQVVLDLASKEGVPIEERRVTEHEFRTADEIFLTGTTVEVLPVVRVNGTAVRRGVPGEVACLLARCFKRLVA